jgi:uncharacterized protein
MTTTATSVQLIQSIYEAFGRGDIDYILARVTPDCKWVAPGEGIPNAGTYSGPAGVAEFFRRMAATEQFLRFEPREYFTNGDDVVALGFEECRALETGATVTTNWAMHFRVRDGLVARFEVFYDTAAYVRAHSHA